MDASVKLIEVTSENVEKVGFFCYMSQRKKPGFSLKLTWLRERFKEGLKIRMLQLPERGFIEYIPGEYAWRPVLAAGYIVIHCLWVVGKSHGKGFARLLLEQCEEDARKQGKNGVVMVSSEGTWLVGKELFLKNGYTAVASAPPSFTLLVKKFRDVPDPSFSTDWQKNSQSAGSGMTIFRTGQCPYIEDASHYFLESAKKKGVPGRVVDLTSAEEVRGQSPSAYGTFGVTCNEVLFSYCYLTEGQVEKQWAEIGLS
jgi:GNAT superfamily N-acetyltransferase